jgi:hypothetical protein
MRLGLLVFNGGIAVLLSIALLVSTILVESNDKLSISGHIINHQCEYLKITDHPCGSCGLSRAWVSISHSKFNDAANFNNSGIITYVAALVFVVGHIAIWLFMHYATMRNPQKEFFFSVLLLAILVGAWLDIIATNVELGTYKLI